MSTVHNTLPDSQHFHLEQLAGGIYAAMSIDGKGSMCNAGIIDLGDRTLVFDTLWTLNAAQDLRRAAEHLTGRPVSYVVNSHYNADHINGNQVFAPTATIISTTGTRDLLATRGVEVNTYLKEHLADEVLDDEKRLAQESDPATREELTLDIATNRALLPDLPTLELHLPNLTFEHRLTLYGTRRQAQLLSFGGGHTPSDSFLYLPEERLAFMGDLLFIDGHPSIWQNNPKSWIDILAQVETLDLATVVPGHGPLGTRQHLTILRQYLEQLRELAASVVKNSGSEDDAAKLPVPAAFASWKGAAIFGHTMRTFYKAVAS